MFLKEFRIQNVKCFEDVTLRFRRPEDREDGGQGGWYVIVGENGTGKSTLLKAIALTLMGPVYANRFGQELDLGRWQRATAAEDPLRPTKPSAAALAATVTANGDEAVSANVVLGDVEVLDGSRDEQSQPVLWSPTSTAGWFSAAYGPYRRISPERARRRPKEVKEDRVASLFIEDLDFATSVAWLASLPPLGTPRADADGASREFGSGDVDELLRRVLHGDWVLIGQSQDSPHGAVGFAADGADRKLWDCGTAYPSPHLHLWDLGDGMRSILALVIDLIRLLDVECRAASGRQPYTLDDVRRTRGVVLIDEPDAHIHPAWQREIGFTLTRMLPNIQFVVSTHSPLVCWAAEAGGIVLLEREPFGPVEARTDSRLVRGWQVEQVLDWLFDVGPYDPTTQEALERHDDLMVKQRHGELNDEEQRQLAEDKRILEERLTVPGETLRERDKLNELYEWVRERRARERSASSGG